LHPQLTKQVLVVAMVRKVRMTERRDAARRPLPGRSRKRWAVAGGVTACWVILLSVTGSATGATVTLGVLGVVGALGVLGLRGLGVTRQHPWVQRLAARPWRDGQDVLQLALRHLPEVFVVTPTGSWLAPNVVELQLNPDDLGSLCERMDIGLICASAAEVYDEQVAAHGARFAGPGPAQVHVIAHPSVMPGRYRLRQGRPVNAGAPAGYPFAPPGPGFRPPDPRPAELPPAYADDRPPGPAPRSAAGQPRYGDFEIHDGQTRAGAGAGAGASGASTSTVMEARRDSIPVLRLLTGDSIAQTRTSGARAGRGDVELQLPQVPTVSRQHARFTFSGSQWWIANLGRNGLAVNGVAVAGECPLSSGDSIRWGTRPDALRSLVEIPRDPS
jgi:pSer/pThr/pTyr-binding forkhead associated (FHA) protein